MVDYIPIRMEERYAILTPKGTAVLVENELESLGCTFAHLYTSRREGERVPVDFEMPTMRVEYTGLLYAASPLSSQEQEHFLRGVRKATTRPSLELLTLR